MVISKDHLQGEEGPCEQKGCAKRRGVSHFRKPEALGLGRG